MEKNNQNLSVVNLLTTLLADGMVLYTKTRNFHWNIKSQNFLFLHSFLETYYTELAEETDNIAEKIRTLDTLAIGSMKEFLEHSTLKESIGKLNSKQMIEALLKDEKGYITHIEDALQNKDVANDPSVSDLLTSMLVVHKKRAWMLQSNIES